MRTLHYNPSTLEVDFAKAFHELSPQLENKINKAQVIEIKADHTMDNPQLTFRLKDNEGDMHEIVVQIIQRPDNMVK
ncbi:hypothetical protein H8S95_04235 [Pontibacter sp. KCTC 32443]|uniref:hypothetical protein n=1 Tax=Pontibacter TaxID=323449 RepID=UPI00164E9C50|nr:MULTISPECIES: hypothetical protein [Pontibacter]MBC5773263.1 hypothetical protein [Pontibacter sp. KCTC 32443]